MAYNVIFLFENNHDKAQRGRPVLELEFVAVYPRFEVSMPTASSSRLPVRKNLNNVPLPFGIPFGVPHSNHTERFLLQLCRLKVSQKFQAVIQNHGTAVGIPVSISEAYGFESHLLVCLSI
jgi:hypothetical protein